MTPTHVKYGDEVRVFHWGPKTLAHCAATEAARDFGLDKTRFHELKPANGWRLHATVDGEKGLVAHHVDLAALEPYGIGSSSNPFLLVKEM
jgi:hypothetical protein